MGQVRRVAVAMGVVAVFSLTALPAWASSSPATHRAAVTTRTKAAGHCHHAHKSCPHSTGSVTGTDGGLTVTFSASETGRTVNFAIAWTETKAYGAVGPEVLSFGDGNSEGFGTPEYCLVTPMAQSGSRQISYTYGSAGSYTAAVTVGANCTPDRLTLTVPVSIS